jgi:hypothetical protein
MQWLTTRPYLGAEDPYSEKLAIDASHLEGSEGEGMRGEAAPMLHRVSKALAAILKEA